MKTFQDHTDLEKANLTEEEVEGLLKYELMELGIVSPQPPTPLPDTGPELEEKVYYQPYLKSYSGLDCVFATAKEAEAFLAMNPLILDTGYPSYQNNVEDPTEFKVETIKAISKSDYESSKGLVEAASKNKKANKEAQEAYEAELSEASSAVGHIWDEWSECRKKKTKSQQIVDTYNQYLVDCDDNTEIALRFLGKAYSQNEIKDAYAFLEMISPFALTQEAVKEAPITTTTLAPEGSARAATFYTRAGQVTQEETLKGVDSPPA
jgi:hypothetical protein